MSGKRTLDDLAVFGGPAAFERFLHVGTPNFGDERAFLGRVQRILDSRRFTNDGPLVRELEAKLSALLRVRHVVAVCNATLGLQLLAHALELRGEVVVPAFTFIATAHAFKWVGVEPAFCDIEERLHGVDPASLEAAIGEKTSALVAVHTWGIASDVPALSAIAAKHNLPLLFDAAPALGCEDSRGPLGSSGTAEVFSLHATKVVGSFEGGVVTTNDGELAYRLRRIRDFGFAGFDNVESLGTNAKMSELHAAAGLTTLEAMPSLVAENRRCYEQYERKLREVPGLRLVDVAARGRSNHQHIVVVLSPNLLCDRDDVVRALQAEGVFARRYFHPGCHRSAPYAERPVKPSFPVTERVASSVISLPTGPTVDDHAIERIVGILSVIAGRAEEFAARSARAVRG